ncbi:uncharacterized protein LOC134709495 [Mytilus trossulus]|uniref:uncharacterized protein LOC134709495 n=1 Tax=Mytilus trossulus TaxID=6551 RepID=UPI003004051A
MEAAYLTCAKQLKTLLLQHDKAVTQVFLFDMKILALEKKIFTSILTGNDIMKTSHERRKSIILGIRIMFDRYKQHKWEKIQELSTHILQIMQQDDEDDQTEPWLTTATQESDNTVTIETDMFCSNYRSF